MIKVRHQYSGKVRDLYTMEDGNLLFVASDRMSAFDVVMAEPVPDKGRVLTALTVFWASLLGDLAPTHIVSVVDEPIEVEGLTSDLDLVGRALIVKPADMLPLECIVRGYVSGSGWKEYKSKGTIHGMPVRAGLRESDALDAPIFTPSTKATVGHDENISFDDSIEIVGKDVAIAARDLSLAAYERAAAHAKARGIIIADTKLELGWIDGELAICDEILTPDSSRFWPADQWVPGGTPPALDKQPLRDWLEANGWDKTPPPPPLPAEVIQASRDRYVEAYERLSEKSFADWPGGSARS
jgi:phosphoribosylaminoimidazole-succinocarboxamide synthase